MSIHRVVVCTAGLIGVVAAPVSQAQPPQAPREIQKLNGDVYWARDNDLHLSVFMVTPDGIIVADPISRDFSTWLKDELGKRFNVPVRYVLYSHKDYDHASGADVFADTAKVVAHENTPRWLGMPPASRYSATQPGWLAASSMVPTRRRSGRTNPLRVSRSRFG